MKAFANFHPLVLFVYFIGAMLLTMLTVNPVLLLLSFLGAYSFACALETPRALLKSLGFYLPVFLLIAVTNPLFVHKGMTILFYLNDNPVTLEAMLYGAASAGMIVSVMYWCRCYNAVMTSDKFLYLFGRVAPKFSLVLSMAIRFVPLFSAQAKRISRTQKTLGLYATDSMLDRLRSMIRVFSSIITWSLENAVDTAASMRARGYGLEGRTSFSIYRFTVRDGVMLSVTLGLFAVSIGEIIAGPLEVVFYPRIVVQPLSPVTLLGYIAAGVVLILPCLNEIREGLLWKYYRSGI